MGILQKQPEVSNMKKLIIIVIAVAVLGGLGYFAFLNKGGNTPQDPKLLLGWWRNTDKDPDAKYTDIQFTDYLEFKEKDICLGYDQDDQNKLSCSKYLPYTVQVDEILVEGNPYYKWRFRGDTLEIQPVFGQMKKETYKKMARVE